MADEKGIKEIKELVAFVFSLIKAVQVSLEDNDIDLWDAKNFIEPIKKLAPAIDNIDDVIPEVVDLSDEEWDELLEYACNEFDIPKENVDYVVDEALTMGRSLLNIAGIKIPT